MSNIACPACAGPDNAGCATCKGTSEVTQEVFDTFTALEASEQASIEFWRNVQMFMYQNGKFKFEAGESVFELDN